MNSDDKRRARQAHDHLRAQLHKHGRADTFVRTRIGRQDLKALLDHYLLLVGVEEGQVACSRCGSRYHLAGSSSCVAEQQFGPECFGGSDY